jgi:SH3-like domain-containing protein
MAGAMDKIEGTAKNTRPARTVMTAAPRLWARPNYRVLLAAILLGGLSTAALAATGDTYEVTSDKANLRAGPSNDANVRTQLGRGEQLIELRREGNWYGVRVTRTGEEGWVFNNLIDRTAQSTLGTGGEVAPATAGFLDLSESFDKVLASINSTLGYPVVSSVRQGENNALRVVATPDWLRATSRDAQLMTVLAIYQLWKNHQNNQPVQVTLLDGEKPYITIADEAGGPRLTVTDHSQRG